MRGTTTVSTTARRKKSVNILLLASVMSSRNIGGKIMPRVVSQIAPAMLSTCTSARSVTKPAHGIVMEYAITWGKPTKWASLNTRKSFTPKRRSNFSHQGLNGLPAFNTSNLDASLIVLRFFICQTQAGLWQEEMINYILPNHYLTSSQVYHSSKVVSSLWPLKLTRELEVLQFWQFVFQRMSQERPRYFLTPSSANTV